MSNSSLVNMTKLSPNHSGARTHSIDRITPHCFVGQVTVSTGLNAFQSTSRQASCNYVIAKDGKVGLCVDEGNRSWCSSSYSNDQRAVTIECASDSTAPYAFTTACYNKLVDLCVDICKRNGKTKLLWISDKTTALNYTPHSDEMVLTVHRWFANKSCPGDWMYSRMGALASAVTAKLSGSTSGGSASAGYSKTQFIKDVQKAIGVTVDGIAGAKTLAATPTVSASTNKKHAVVKPLQNYLNALGYSCGTADGVAGAKFTAAVKQYQKANGCTADGVITAKATTWKKLLGLA